MWFQDFLVGELSFMELVGWFEWYISSFSVGLSGCFEILIKVIILLAYVSGTFIEWVAD